MLKFRGVILVMVLTLTVGSLNQLKYVVTDFGYFSFVVDIFGIGLNETHVLIVVVELS